MEGSLLNKVEFKGLSCLFFQKIQALVKIVAYKTYYSGYQNKWNVEMHKSENQLLLFGYQWTKNESHLILKP